ncbi:MAG: glucose-1-phosphate thymidylyltransferase [Candidatus Neomarinimicrobiota bacterium]|nr:glucose-1-phosphate thymidylyltransferase [Candidatus Neomarinimicrobiota bacterium]
MKALLTAGGHGTRLRPITYTQNKHLIPIANKLMLQYAIDYLKESDIYEIGIIINANDESIINAFGDGKNYGVEITYIEQDQPLGLAHVVKISQSFIGSDDFIFYLGDNILVGGVKSFINDFKKMKSNCHLVLSQVPDPNRFGVADIVDNQIVNIQEKPVSPRSNLAVTGIYLYDSNIFEAVNNIKPSKRGELEISDAHQFLIENGYEVSFSEITGWWKDTGQPSDLLDANCLVLDNIKSQNNGNIDDMSKMTGEVIIGKNSSIINSIIKGPVIIDNDCTIKDSYIGPYSSIGKNCKITNAKVEYSILMEGCVLDSLNQIMKSSLLGKNVKVVGSNNQNNNSRFLLGDQSYVELVD